MSNERVWVQGHAHALYSKPADYSLLITHYYLIFDPLSAK